MSGRPYIFTRDEPLSEQEHLILDNYSPEPLRYGHAENIVHKLDKQRNDYDSPEWVFNSGHQKPDEGAHQTGSNAGDGANQELAYNDDASHEMTDFSSCPILGVRQIPDSGFDRQYDTSAATSRKPDLHQGHGFCRTGVK
ncbi:hypothetical protein BO82DRAFT_434085 [Aspergillus uvarum CBS 121591]|uniref:Uncharacterized protein n=1 Tax=Aspergillus uvarum CBS 121591 TaxID=1448315 RepID=A0A319C6Q7_9EURO|nr:hypothetical protein BO82DRAFT_434085 [Aspergillus uvarum CBS 121591]PYH79587.1 hypothetical protein BO82DRAFT_434085 [Aspergillus uvarum CBS 121591]